MSDQPMCQACNTFPAHVFDPDGTMRCAGCAYLDLPTASSMGTEAGDPEAWRDGGPSITYMAADAVPTWPRYIVTPGSVDSLDDADKAYVWADVCGAHWAWTEAHGWLAWSTGVAPYERGAVAPFYASHPKPVADVGPRVTFTADEVFAVPPVDEPEVDDQGADGDMVNHPAHYTQGPPCKGCGRPIECLDVTEGMGFCLGNTVKYVWRCDLKHDAIEDLRKARVYLDREIARREQQSAANETKG
ncbi:hypothetical protein SEA_HAMMY_54 [Mycobacterium phage Hammy]|uniref:Uncharacterized protein n=1 Tax=Mycobacterium phage DarthP TaxID=2015879 RepID=A0A286MRC5_9CAUD|nr:hypothetical protein I5G86_gp45 [Mycobacterium phage DarthP]APD18217.1 hypothetical protein SEA_HAMMY_54 [Mycobacterium phage Hammy]ASW31800.1 hypothetical protein SEA_DARTHP_54 [Mycobacterium phage DarthP]